MHCEGGADAEEVDRLEALGYDIVRWRRRNLFFGGVSAVEMRAEDGSTRRIAYGSPAPEAPSVQFPLVHQGQNIGDLVAGLRSGQSSLDVRETRLLEDIARQVVVLASNELSGHVTGQVVTVAGGMEGRVLHE